MKHLQQIMMITAYNEVHPKLIRNLHGTGAFYCEIQSVERSRPGYSLHQGTSLWNDTPAGAAPVKNTETRLYKPQHSIFSPNLTRQVYPVTARTGKKRNGHRFQGLFQGRNN